MDETISPRGVWEPKQIAKLEDAIMATGGEIRAIKDRLKKVKNVQDEALLKKKLEELAALKETLPLGHLKRPEERAKMLEKEKQGRKQKDSSRFLSEAELSMHLVQRKIHNIFATLQGSEDDCGEEETTPRFRLDKMKLNVAKTGLDFNLCTIIATEKWDGTTMQATREGLFKRRDMIARGDPRKFNAGERERYTLIEVNIHHSSHSHLRGAVAKYLDVFARLPPGVTVYFEAVGPRIQARYRDCFANGVTGLIRVFDSSKDGVFLPFGETVKLAESLGLPMVHAFEFSAPPAPRSENDLIELILKTKREAVSYSAAPELNSLVELEGYVFRCTKDSSKVAKLRVCDLEPLGLF